MLVKEMEVNKNNMFKREKHRRQKTGGERECMRGYSKKEGEIARETHRERKREREREREDECWKEVERW